MDTALCTRLVAEHQARGGWGLSQDPLEGAGWLVIAEGMLQVNESVVHMDGQYCNGCFTAHGTYGARGWGTQLPWTSAPPAPDATWTVVTGTPRPDDVCLLVRISASTSTFGAINMNRSILTQFHLCVVKLYIASVVAAFLFEFLRRVVFFYSFASRFVISCRHFFLNSIFLTQFYFVDNTRHLFRIFHCRLHCDCTPCGSFCGPPGCHIESL
jgi:hypothetical protein